MKHIIENRYVKTFRFNTSREANIFLANNYTVRTLSLTETVGDNYFCFIFFDSLTNEKQFLISFCGDDAEEELILLYWSEAKIFVLGTNKKIWLISDEFSILASFEISTTLIGLSLIKENTLLLLEEASLTLIDSQGRLIKTELFDLIEDFNLEDNLLNIRTANYHRSYKLI